MENEPVRYDHARYPDTDIQESRVIVDAKNLSGLAAGISERLKIVVDPLTLLKRADDNVDAMRNALAGLASNPEEVEQDPRLQRYHTQYEQWKPEFKSRCSWEEVNRRLLANQGKLLERASAMNEGGVLFGVDGEGNPLVADGGADPSSLPIVGLKYLEARNKVMFEEVDGVQVPTGYELFPREGRSGKGPEISMYEKYTEQFFVFPSKEEDNDPFYNGPAIASWVESGDRPYGRHYVVHYDPSSGWSEVNIKPQNISRTGARRLLRLRRG